MIHNTTEVDSLDHNQNSRYFGYMIRSRFLHYGPEMSEYCQRKLDTTLIHNFASLVDIVGLFYGNE